MAQLRKPQVIRAVPATLDGSFSRWTGCPGIAFWAREGAVRCPANSPWSSDSGWNRRACASTGSGLTCETLSISLGKPAASLQPLKISGYRESSSWHSVFRWTRVSLWLTLVTATIATSFMSAPGPVKISGVAMILLLAMPLMAQRYQGRDHHVFHAPVPTKHQSAPPAGTATQTRVSTTTTASSAHRRDTNPNLPRSNDPARPQMPPTTDTPHPHQ
jgi:hypothetical protein